MNTATFNVTSCRYETLYPKKDFFFKIFEQKGGWGICDLGLLRYLWFNLVQNMVKPKIQGPYSQNFLRKFVTFCVTLTCKICTFLKESEAISVLNVRFISDLMKIIRI